MLLQSCRKLHLQIKSRWIWMFCAWQREWQIKWKTNTILKYDFWFLPVEHVAKYFPFDDISIASTCPVCPFNVVNNQGCEYFSDPPAWEFEFMLLRFFIPIRFSWFFDNFVWGCWSTFLESLPPPDGCWLWSRCDCLFSLINSPSSKEERNKEIY